MLLHVGTAACRAAGETYRHRTWPGRRCLRGRRPRRSRWGWPASTTWTTCASRSSARTTSSCSRPNSDSRPPGGKGGSNTNSPIETPLQVTLVLQLISIFYTTSVVLLYLLEPLPDIVGFVVLIPTPGNLKKKNYFLHRVPVCINIGISGTHTT